MERKKEMWKERWASRDRETKRDKEKNKRHGKREREHRTLTLSSIVSSQPGRETETWREREKERLTERARELTLSSFMSPSSCTMSSRRLSCSADMRASSSSRRWRSRRSSASRVGLRPSELSSPSPSPALIRAAASCSLRSRWISFRMSLQTQARLKLNHMNANVRRVKGSSNPSSQLQSGARVL